MPLLEALESRYRDFLAPKASTDLLVQLRPHQDVPPHFHPAPECIFDGLQIFFDLPGYVGYIDPLRGAGLRIASPDPVSGSDYFLRVVFSVLAFQAGGLMVHAAGVLRGRRAFLFLGHSGAGKSTVAANSPDDTILNDDLIILLPGRDGWTAHGTPFTHPGQARPSPGCGPAAALLFLHQSPRVSLEPLSPAQSLAALLASTPVLNAAPEPPLDRCQAVVSAVPAFALHLLPDPSFWPHVESI